MIKSGTVRLLVVLALSHASAGVLAIAAAQLLDARQVALGWQIAAGAALAAATGLLMTAGLRGGVESAAAAVTQLAAGLPIATLPSRGRTLLLELFAGLDALATREREWEQGRAAVLLQAEQTAAQDERNRLARDLHDSIKQQLFSINSSAATAQARWVEDPTGARAALDDVRQSAREANAEMQALLQQLRPVPLSKAGLLDALRDQCEALGYRTNATVVTAFGELPDEERLPPGAQEALFRIGQEALSNVARHARATEVKVRLRVEARPAGEALCLEISDNGRGFDPASPPAGMGLGNMAERARRVRAGFEIDAAQGRGTTIRVCVPLIETSNSEREAAVNATIQTALRQGERAQTGLALGVGLTLFMILSTLPVIARTIMGGPQFAGLQVLIPGALALAGLALAGYSRARLRKAENGLIMTAGEQSAAHLRFRREITGQQMWYFLTAMVILPIALLRPNYPQFPLAAIALGAFLAVLYVLQVLRQQRAEAAWWESLDRPAHNSEVNQAWAQRYKMLAVLVVTVPGYLYLLGAFSGTPVDTWFSLPPGRDQAINIVVTFYVLAMLTWIVVNYRHLRHWRERVQG